MRRLLNIALATLASCAGTPQKQPAAPQPAENIAPVRTRADKSILPEEFMLHPTVSLALETIAAIGSLGYPIDCERLVDKMRHRFVEIGAIEVPANQLPSPIYHLPDSETAVWLTVFAINGDTRSKIFSLYIQDTGTNLNRMGGIFKGIVSTECIARPSGL